VATVICQTEVASDDPAFTHPSKPIGSFMDAEQAERRRQQGWNLVEDANRGYRRVVASPTPLRIVELPVIRRLVDAGIVVITAGGGGIPVVATPEGGLMGVAAVIDKDLGSALLANDLGADLLLISTAVDRVALNFGTPQQQWVDRMTLADAKRYLAEGVHFAKGSMAPKIQAVVNYLERGGKEALITNPQSIGLALQGTAGTRIVPG
jgi:carbamate kinase